MGKCTAGIYLTWVRISSGWAVSGGCVGRDVLFQQIQILSCFGEGDELVKISPGEILAQVFFQSGIRRVTRPGRSKGYKEYKWGRAGGSWSAEQFLKLDWSAERKRKNRSERGAPIFFRISQYFPDFSINIIIIIQV